jgi:hypothetical protein
MRISILALAFTLCGLTAAHADNPYAGTPEAKLAEARLDAAHKSYDGLVARWKRGQATLDEVFAWSVRWLDAELEPTVGADIDRALRDHAKRMHDVETVVAAQYKRGLATSADVAMTAYYRLDADMRVLAATIP